jgi:N-formylglutamate amidohydrolase
VLLLDLHSVGDGHGTTADPRTIRRASAAFPAAGFEVALNCRFAVGFIVRRFAGHERVHSIQVELNQRCYLRRSDIDASLPRGGDGSSWASKGVWPMLDIVASAT